MLSTPHKSRQVIITVYSKLLYGILKTQVLARFQCKLLYFSKLENQMNTSDLFQSS